VDRDRGTRGHGDHNTGTRGHSRRGCCCCCCYHPGAVAVAVAAAAAITPVLLLLLLLPCVAMWLLRCAHRSTACRPLHLRFRKAGLPLKSPGTTGMLPLVLLLSDVAAV
jgi:hypothetical protein